jgi:hypothetical protein
MRSLVEMALVEMELVEELGTYQMVDKFGPRW